MLLESLIRSVYNGENERNLRNHVSSVIIRYFVKTAKRIVEIRLSPTTQSFIWYGSSLTLVILDLDTVFNSIA